MKKCPSYIFKWVWGGGSNFLNTVKIISTSCRCSFSLTKWLNRLVWTSFEIFPIGSSMPHLRFWSTSFCSWKFWYFRGISPANLVWTLTEFQQVLDTQVHHLLQTRANYRTKRITNDDWTIMQCKRNRPYVNSHSPDVDAAQLKRRIFQKACRL